MIYVVVGLIVCLITQIMFIQCSIKELKDDIQNLRNWVMSFRDRLITEHEYTQQLVNEASDKLNILVTPIEENVANVAKKLFVEASKVDKED